MKKLVALLLTLSLSTAIVTGSVNNSLTAKANESGKPDTVSAAQAPVKTAEKKNGKAPKYVFLFIGDGMSYPQFQAASDFLGAMADSDYMLAEPSIDDNKGLFWMDRLL